MSKMSRQDFQMIASVIADLCITHGNAAERAQQRESIAEAFADVLGSTNQAFKRTLFIQAATGQVAVTARKAKLEGPPDTVATRKAMQARTLASDLAEDR